MIKATLIKKGLTSVLAAAILVPALSLSIASAASSTAGSSTAANTTLMNNIISKGNNEIARRLTTLNTLDSKISSSTKISSGDKTSLTGEVNSEISGLGTTKTTLDACTNVSCAKTAAQSIFTEYRVYALVVPQVEMIKTADDQQLTQAKLTTMAGQLAIRVSKSSNTSLQTDLTTMNSDITAGSSLSESVETSVGGLTPQNYDNNHSILVQYYGNLKTAQSDNQAAYAQAKTIVAVLGSAPGQQN